MRPRSVRLLAAQILLLAAAACGDDGDGGSGSASGGDAEPPEQEGMTAAHNAARAAVEPAADPAIPPLVWDGTLASYAQAHADKCVFEHSTGPYGENLYAESGLGAGPEDVVASWVAEAADYDYATNGCSGVCGHYTQVVWAATQRLGCGFTMCSENSPFGGGSWALWVCSYDPPGNYVGEKPY